MRIRAARSCRIGSVWGEDEEDGAKTSASKNWPYIRTSDEP